ncbi:MAG: hypothetical protein ACE5FL_01485 [Myxococcota bacterium]
MSAGLLPLSLALLATVVFVAAYLVIVRPWQLRWGSRDEELARGMPGDEVVARPTFDATRAVTVEAPAGAIWPWIVQMGIERAGWYSYDWIDNLGRRSAERILPEFQDARVGQLVPMSPNQKHGLWVKDFSENQWMLWWDKKGEASWCWELYPEGAGGTRLITRVRIRYHWLSPAILFHLLFDVGDIVMMRKCMLGIRRRAETHARSSATEANAAP